MTSRVGEARGRSAVLLVPGAMIAANLGSYVLVLVAARRLSHAEYGVLLSLLGVLLIATVPSLVMQTVAARRTAIGAHAGGLLAGTAAIAAATSAVLLVAAPALYAFLHLRSAWGLLAVVAAVAPLTFLGTAQGVAQGARHFRQLAALTLATVGSRAVGGITGLLVTGSPAGCLVGSALALWGTALVAMIPVLPRLRPVAASAPLRDLLTEALHAGHGHSAFLLLASVDVLLARHVLDPKAAGLYAAGSVVTRAALWLPQSVAAVMFATFADHDRHRRAYTLAVVGVAAIGLVTVAGAALLGRPLVSLVAGAGYHGLDRSVWIFALVGSSLALLQLSLLAGFAVLRRGRIALVWAVVVADCVVVLSMHAPHAIDVARALALVSLVGGLVSAAAPVLRRQRHTRQEEVPVALLATE